MGNVTIFSKAFKDCGIGGRFSSFQLVQSNEWFELVDIDHYEDSRFCYRVYDQIDRRRYREIKAYEALALHADDPHWLRYFETARKVIAKIVSKGTTKANNSYYIDDLHKSVFVVNRMYVIEITPVQRSAPEVVTDAVYEFLGSCTAYTPTLADQVIVQSMFGKVVAGVNGKWFNSLMTPEEFNQLFSESV